MSLQDRVVTSAGELLLQRIASFIEVQGIAAGCQSSFEAEGRPAFGPPPWGWLCLALEAAADLLGAAYSHQPVRQLLDTLLDNVMTENDGAVILTNARKRLKRLSDRLLVLDCGTVAELLRRVVERLVAYEKMERKWKEEAGKLHSEADSKICEALARTPVSFTFRERNYHFPYLQSLLLESLLAGEETYDVEVIEHVWGGVWDNKVNICRNRLHQLQLATNAALREKKLPFEIARPRSNYLRLKKPKR